MEILADGLNDRDRPITCIFWFRRPLDPVTSFTAAAERKTSCDARHLHTGKGPGAATRFAKEGNGLRSVRIFFIRQSQPKRKDIFCAEAGVRIYKSAETLEQQSSAQKQNERQRDFCNDETSAEPA